MATAVWQNPKVQVDFTTPWAKKGGVAQPWSCSFCVTGGLAPIEAGDGQAWGLGFWEAIVQPLVTGNTEYIGGKAYNGNNSIAVQMWEETGRTGNHSAYVTPGSGEQQLEVVLLWEAYVRNSTTNKPVYLRKHIHDVLADSTGNTHSNLNSSYISGANAFWSAVVGGGPAVCDPVTGAVPASWSVKPALYTRQLRKGDERAKTGG